MTPRGPEHKTTNRPGRPVVEGGMTGYPVTVEPGMLDALERRREATSP